MYQLYIVHVYFHFKIGVRVIYILDSLFTSRV